MINYVKQELLKQPNVIIRVLENYGYYRPTIQHNEIRCGLEEGGNPTGIRIKLTNNDGLFVIDFIRNIRGDLFSYIVKTRKTDFKSVFAVIKRILGIDTYEDLRTAPAVFGGFYDKIRRRTDDIVSKVYPDSILTQYEDRYSARFLRDNISAKSQKVFEIGYDLETQRITIPIRNVYGELIGVKGRANWDIDENEPKYLYIIPCRMSSTLFGYAQNYPYINDNQTILIGESEKFVMQAYTYGIKNCLGLGSNSLSGAQCKLLLELNPKRVIFMLDKSLDPKITKANAEKLRVYARMFDLQIGWWDWTKNTLLPEKASPSDFGKQTFLDIIKKEVCEIEG